MPTLLPALTLGVALLARPPEQAPDPAAHGHFDYDRKAPLELREHGVELRGDVSVRDISYASPKGGRVPAYLVVPNGKGPFAAVVWGHWYQERSPVRNRREFLDEAVAFARSGVISLLPDGPVARPEYVPSREPLSDRQAKDLVQQIVDLRRGVDLLAARPDVDPRRLAYVGHSYNASVGAILSGVDRRFKAFVLMAGTLSDAVDLKSSETQSFRQKVGPAKFDAYVAKYAWLDQGKYVAHAAPATVFMQYATREKFLTPARARQYAALVSKPKRLELYDAPHALNAAARRDRLAFLAEQLGVAPPPPEVTAAIPEVVQPVELGQ